MPSPETGPVLGLRIDKWLWFARFVKTRSQAKRLLESGETTVNGKVVSKTSFVIRIGDHVAFPAGRNRRQVRVTALGWRRGGAPEAATLYDEETPSIIPGEE